MPPLWDQPDRWILGRSCGASAGSERVRCCLATLSIDWQGSDVLLKKTASCSGLAKRQYWYKREGCLHDSNYVFRKAVHMHSTWLVDTAKNKKQTILI